MVLASLIPLFAVPALAHLNRRFTVSDTPQGTVDAGVISDCTYWANVQSGDTCASIENYFGITQDEFISYNPSLKSDCSGLTVGHSYCVEENYGRGPAPTTSTSTSSPKPTSTGTTPSPTQSGLASNCQRYYKVASGDTCQAIVDSYGTFTLSDFYGWNPSVGSSCTNLQVGYYVCVGIPGTPTSRPATTSSSATNTGPQPEQSGISSDCKAYYKVVSGDSCQGIVDHYGTFTLQQFYGWNPAVGSSCTNLQVGYYVCVGVSGTPTTKPTSTTLSTKTTTSPSPTGPSPTQSGIASNCTKYYKAASGDTCTSIANNFKTFTVDQFEQWNPAVGSGCTNLQVGYYYCIAIPGTPTTPLSTSTPAPTSTATGPQPQESGTVSNCKTYYKVVSGDTCDTIEKKYSITANQFFTWNKGISTDCKNLWTGYYVCVGV